MSATPRAVVVRRRSDYELLLARHGTRGQAKFFLASRGQDIDEIEFVHSEVEDVRAEVLRSLPPRWRRVELLRDEFGRFLFEPHDVVVAVGQDGLVANVAKYLSGQFVVGVNPLASRFDGVLVRAAREVVGEWLASIDAGERVVLEERTMVAVRLGDGQSLLALNEIFVGHRTHQSARYRIGTGKALERQSSSGVIVASGTGATGWARSISSSRRTQLELPRPDEARLVYFVREAFPSVATGTKVVEGSLLPKRELQVVSEMNEGGVVFGDGIESDHLRFGWGESATIGIAKERLRLVVGVAGH